MTNRGVYIVSADAKDLFLSNYSNEFCCGYDIRYRSGVNKGSINTRKFVNTLDYSKDLIKLPEVYEKVYRRSDFTFTIKGKEYCKRVINVTFKYSVKEYNLFFDNTYIKFGYTPNDISLFDNVCVIDGELAAIRINSEVDSPITNDILGSYFEYNGSTYVRTSKHINVVHSVSWLREKLYKDGFTCDGIKFCRFKRSCGSSRIGKCLFIDARLYSRIHKWELCGLRVSDGQDIDLAALEAYIALTLSSIIGLVRIEPENFLIIDDYDSVFDDEAIAVRSDANGNLVAKKEIVEISNCIWDGQSLIDKSIMGEYSDKGMILLRNRFFKSACFNCNLQQFFADNGITSVSQLNGKTIATDIRDIKIITTPSSIKYYKFGSLEQWLELLRQESDFGVVKYEKPTHFFGGDMVQVHYQLLNTLQMTQDEVDLLVKPSLDYLYMIQNDPVAMRFHLKYGGSDQELEQASTANDIVYQMLGLTDKFHNTKLYYDFMMDVSRAYRKNLRKGHILVNGNYSTLLGNPVEMMYSAIGKFDGESIIGVGHVSSKRFANNQMLLGSRSPHVTMGNVLVTKNVYNASIDRYVNMTNEIVCVNSINENILFRLSGADFDSDTMLLTDNPILISAALRNYEKFPVPTALVAAKKLSRVYTKEEQADLDIKTSVNKIGEIVNLSQELNSRLWDMLNSGADFSEVEELYCDIAKLDVLSNIEIDKAKREYVVDSVAEVKAIKQKYLQRDDSGRQIKPNFLGKIAMSKGYYDSSKKNYMFHDTTMDYLQHSLNKNRGQRCKPNIIPFSDLLVADTGCETSIWYPQIEKVTAIVREARAKISAVWSNTSDGLSNEEKKAVASDIRDEMFDTVKSIKMNANTAYRLLQSIEDDKNKDISRTLFYALFSLPNETFLNLLEERRELVMTLEENDAGSIQIFNSRYRKVPIGSVNRWCN